MVSNRSLNGINGVLYIRNGDDNPFDTYSIIIDPSIESPSVGFIPQGGSEMFTISSVYNSGIDLQFRNGDRVVASIFGSSRNGAVMNIEELKSTSLSHASRVIVCDDMGNIGSATTLIPKLGGTGMDRVPDANTLLGSDGSKYVSVRAGSNIVIRGDTISTTTGPSFDNISIDTPPSVPGMKSIIDPSGKDYYEDVIEFTSNSNGISTICSIIVPQMTAMTIRIISVRTSSRGSGGTIQYAHASRKDTVVTVVKFGQSTNTPQIDSEVKIDGGIGTLDLRISLSPGDMWRGHIQIISIPVYSTTYDAAPHT